MIEKASKLRDMAPVKITGGHSSGRGFMASAFKLLIQPFADKLPNLTIVLNMLDEPRVLFPTTLPDGITREILSTWDQSAENVVRGTSLLPRHDFHDLLFYQL